MVATDSHGDDDAICPSKAHEALDFSLARAEFMMVAEFREEMETLEIAEAIIGDAFHLAGEFLVMGALRSLAAASATPAALGNRERPWAKAGWSRRCRERR